MSGMSRNPYAEELEGYVDPRNSLEASAIIALAYEQRTANLISILNGRAFIPLADYQALEKSILERLDIDAEPTK